HQLRAWPAALPAEARVSARSWRIAGLTQATRGEASCARPPLGFGAAAEAEARRAARRREGARLRHSGLNRSFAALRRAAPIHAHRRLAPRGRRTREPGALPAAEPGGRSPAPRV